MTEPHKLRRLGRLFIRLALLGAVLAWLVPMQITYTRLEPAPDLPLLSSRVYVHSEMPESGRLALSSSLEGAEARLAAFFCELESNTLILTNRTPDQMRTLGSKTNREGKTQLTPFFSVIVLGPEGARSRDIIAYELARAEFSARIREPEPRPSPSLV